VFDGLGDLIILDVVMPDENGLDLIPKIKEIRKDIKIIVISAQNTILTAMQAIEKGAYEYLAKPFDINELNKVIDIAFADNVKSSNTNIKIKEKKIVNDNIPIIGSSPLMQKVFKSVAKLINTDLTVMIFGESGTGKELVAKVLHEHGKRKKGPFVAINMAAIPKELIESELFGLVKAPVNEPFSWPNNSLSINSFGIAAILIATNGPFFLFPCSCKTFATSSFPVPDSPKIITVKSVLINLATDLKTFCIKGEDPIIGILSFTSFFSFILIFKLSISVLRFKLVFFIPFISFINCLICV
jgi:CheY-like chemotaxis protein